VKKLTSKRRWIARFRLGRSIPSAVVMIWPELKSRLTACVFNPHLDTLRKPD
jgi:hypothetical protein